MATKIPWAMETWNPLNGCSKISEGCRNCYAEKLAARLKAMGVAGYKDTINEAGQWSGKITANVKQLDKPMNWKRGKIIFVCSMGDLFHDAVPTVALHQILSVIKKCPQHTFLLLTKRPENALAASQSVRFSHFFDLPNIWMGVTAENQEMLNKRIPILLQIPAAKRFVSIEPMLGSIDITNKGLRNAYSRPTDYYTEPATGKRIGIEWTDPGDAFIGLDWVICGCESGPARRPMDIEWAKNLKNQCVSAGVPFFFKQKYIGTKKIVMPLLDEQVWDQAPEPLKF